MRLFEVTEPTGCPRTKATDCSCDRLRQLAEAEQTIEAVAVLGHGDAKGMISFKQKPGKATIISGTVTGLSEGLHGLHIHEFGDLSDGCDSAGGHYNPTGVDHGDIDNGHVGDLGNITADSNGVAKFSIKAKRIHLQGATSIVGRAVVVHEGEDDLGKGGDEESLKTGNAGERAGCGVISLTELTESAIAKTIEDLPKNITDKHFSRSEMPQVKRPHLEKSKIPHKDIIIKVADLKPVQSERVKGLAQDVADDYHSKDKPFILDKDNYLVNGHHRYDAARWLGIKKVNAIRVEMPIEFLQKEFSHTTSNAMAEDVVGMNPQAVKPYFSPQEADRANDEWVNQAQVDQEDGVIVKATDGKQYRIMTSYGNQHFEDGEVYLDGVTDPEYLDTDGYPDAAELLYYHSATGHYPEEDYEVAENYKSQDVTKQGRNLSAKVKQYLKGKKTELTTVKVSNLDMDTPGFDRIIGDLGDVNFADTTDPIVVDADGKTILDGFHRVQKAKDIGKEEIPAYMVIENLKAKLLPENIQRGDCFEAAIKQMLEYAKENPAMLNSLSLVHGYVTGQGSYVKDQRYGHGWLEIGDVVHDCTKNAIMRKEQYYKLGNINPNELKKYSYKDVLQKISATNHNV